MVRWAHRLLVVSLALHLVVGADPVAAQDGATGDAMYGARPAHPDAGSGAFVLSIPAGSSAADAIELLNFSDEAVIFDLYPTDAVPTAEGGHAPAAREADVTGSGVWVTFASASVEVAARGAESVSFSVDVPGGTTLGHHLTALVAEPQTVTDRGTVAARTRIGLWLKVTVTAGVVEPEEDEPDEEGAWAPWGWPWSVIIPGLLALLLWLEFMTRDRRRQWFRERREERALVKDLRARRRLRPATKKH
jgi:hypothetical protein